MNGLYKITLCLVLLVASACSNGGENTEKKVAATSNTPEKNNQKPAEKQKNILFFGNSLTAAYGLEPSEGFAGVIQEKLETLELNYKVSNAGNSGETTDGGDSRVNWVLSQQKSLEIFVLELGGNDGLRGLSTSDAYNNLQSIIDKVKAKFPEAKIVIAGMEAPPNMGGDYTQAFRKIYPKLAKENEASLIPFLLDGVAGIPNLNLPDGIHPTVEGHKIVAENVWKIIKDLL